MQTFLPYADYAKCASVLDKKRLGNQFYNEGMIILAGNSKWKSYPAVKMWSPWKYQLCLYLLAMSDELRERGFYYKEHIEYVETWKNQLVATGTPPWLGNDKLHSSHRANLIRKDPVWYGKYGWKEQPSNIYLWPK